MDERAVLKTPDNYRKTPRHGGLNVHSLMFLHGGGSGSTAVDYFTDEVGEL
jgi:hypothetical protein